MISPSQVALPARDRWLVARQSLTDLQGPLVISQGLVTVAGIDTQIVKSCPQFLAVVNVGWILADQLLQQGNRALVGVPGLSRPSQVPINRSQIAAGSDEIAAVHS